ncbi:hypothetical protein EG68_03951 [Paragonimus skrjabini miyazakii]|uniref:Uncharacterized protein n=1 Tax=Paragonimus skrjabini miyazakii TaxID=59628 RepID=A0A8S9Z0W1_9TREM|nr:hypothetical protein EG68_03951 [Paragonimus skrjabini miyazakii]
MRLLNKILTGALCVLLMGHVTLANVLHRTTLRGDLADDGPYEAESNSRFENYGSRGYQPHFGYKRWFPIKEYRGGLLEV